MFTHHLKSIAARVGAVTLLSAGMIVGFAGTPALAQTQTTHTTGTSSIYTVLGDSYSAGSGGGGEVGACGQSPNGYGPWVAAKLGTHLENLACAGFTTDQVRTLEVPYLQSGTKVITLTAGGNDVAWTAAITACLAPTSTATMCQGAVANSIHLMSKLPKSVTSMLKAVKAKAPGAKVLYLGYPRLFEPQNMAALGYTPTQISGTQALNAAADLLNGTLAYSALSNRVAFVPVAYLFSGHAVPSANPWLNYPGGPNPYAFHPNAAGYQYGYAAALKYFL
ncbi:SGNH/GDSL hydrolase family protein [Arthrobacter sp. lap29]|uniref:SGNH/GDSL hydrolase family protein n=1 Tax=Arthrobacter sp. lap29 TaxID=3056122 RepID=UPI0028F6FE23|nr:SGNH/GDSL hydrolase family protein [Arthrobacter sp. lap29]